MNDKPYLNPDFCTRNDAARLAGVTVLTISNWIRSGRIRALTLDGRVYVEKASLPPLALSTLGQRLQHARKEAKLKGDDVHRLLGIDKHTLSKYENDSREVTPERLSKLATLYGVSVKWLINGGQE